MTARQTVFVGSILAGFAMLAIVLWIIAPSGRLESSIYAQVAFLPIFVSGFVGAWLTPYHDDAAYERLSRAKAAVEDAMDVWHAKLEAERLEHARTAEDLELSRQSCIELAQEAAQVRVGLVSKEANLIHNATRKPNGSKQSQRGRKR